MGREKMKIKRSILFLCVVLFCAVAGKLEAEERFVFLGKNNLGSLFYLDKETVRREGARVRFWIKVIPSSGQLQDALETIRDPQIRKHRDDIDYAMDLNLMDMQRRALKTELTLFYLKDGTSLRYHQRPIWEPVVPGTMGEIFHQILTSWIEKES